MKAFLGFILIFLSCSTTARPLTIAVATNFNHVMNSLVEKFEEKYKKKINISYGATGSLYAQIINGAPFDAFFSADTKTIDMLIERDLARVDSQFIYAKGALVFFCESCLGSINWSRMINEENKKISIANPRFAPYGFAAVEALKSLPNYQKINGRLVYANNVGQAFQFIKTNNTPYGIVSKSLIIAAKTKGSKYQEILASLYSPILQSAVILKRSVNIKVIRLFFEFIKSKDGSEIILKNGYTLDEFTND